MQKIILEKHDYGWSAMFFGVPKMPEDVEIPLSTVRPLAYLHTIANDMRKRYPKATLLYRDKTGHLSNVA